MKERPYTSSDYGFLAVGSLFYFTLFLFSYDHPFFGDCVNLGSRYAHWFLESGFTGIIPPAGVDSGNPPFFGLYLGLWWAALGRSLFVAHLAMLPFMLGMVWCFHRLARYFFEGKWVLVALIPLLLEPTLVAQVTMLSPDLPLTFFFLVAVVGLVERRAGLQTLGMLGMPLLSTRGIMTVAVIFVAELLLLIVERNRNFENGHKAAWRSLLKYVPAGLAAVAWLGYHYLAVGWISYNRETMPWAGSFEVVGLKGYIRNLAILGWRILDFGRVAWWLVAAVLAACIWQSRKWPDVKLRLLMILTVAPALVLLPVLARYSGLLQHRYLIQIFLMFGLMVCYALYQFPLKNSLKKLSLLFIAVALLTGHLWKYPSHIAQGWDASLAHVPYFELRDQLKDFILEKNIDPASVITGTPNQFSYKETNATDDTWTFTHIDEVERKDAKYVFYSNAFNDIPDDFVLELFGEWTVIQRYEKMGIEVVLFKKE